MGKTKSFAEKMLKSGKKVDDNITYRVIRPNVSAKGSIRFENKIVIIHKDQDEKKVLGV